MHVGAVLVLGASPGFSVTEAQRLLAGRIRGVPRLRQRLRRAPPGCGRPFWADDPAFDVRRHVRSRPCPAPGGERALLDVAAALFRVPLPRSRPLWSATFVTGLEDGGTGLVVVMHHVLADGIGGLAVLAGLVDEPPGQPPAPPPAAGLPGPRPGRSADGPVPAACPGCARAGRGCVGGPAARPRPPGGPRAHGRAGPGRTGRRPAAPPVPGHLAEPADRARAAPRRRHRRSRRGPRPGPRLRRHGQRRRAGRHRRRAARPAGPPGRGTGPGHRLGPGVGPPGGHGRPARQPGRGDAGDDPGRRPDGRPGDPGGRDHPVRKTAARGTSAALLGPLFRLLARTGLLRAFVNRQRLVHTFATNLRGPAETAHVRRCPGAGGDPRAQHHRQRHRHLRRALVRRGCCGSPSCPTPAGCPTWRC